MGKFGVIISQVSTAGSFNQYMLVDGQGWILLLMQAGTPNAGGRRSGQRKSTAFKWSSATEVEATAQR
jgi:hypothetical protein